MLIFNSVDWLKDDYGLPDLYWRATLIVYQVPVKMTGKLWLADEHSQWVLTATWNF